MQKIEKEKKKSGKILENLELTKIGKKGKNQIKIKNHFRKLRNLDLREFRKVNIDVWCKLVV